MEGLIKVVKFCVQRVVKLVRWENSGVTMRLRGFVFFFFFLWKLKQWLERYCEDFEVKFNCGAFGKFERWVWELERCEEEEGLKRLIESGAFFVEIEDQSSEKSLVWEDI